MAKHSQSPSQCQQSVKLRAKPLKGPSFKVADISVEGDIYVLSDDNEHTGKKSTQQSSEMLSTAELISAVGKIWDSASRSLTRLQPKASDPSCNVYRKDIESYYSIGNDNLGILDLHDSRYLDVHLNSSRYVPYMVQRSLNRVKLVRGVSYKPCDDLFIQNLFPNWHDGSIRHDVCPKEGSLTNTRIPYCLIDSYRWMRQISPLPKLPVFTSWEPKKFFDPTSEAAASACYLYPGNEVSLPSNLRSGSIGSCINKPNLMNLPSDESATVIMNGRQSVSSLRSAYTLKAVEDTHSAGSMSTAASLRLHEDYHASISAAGCTQKPNTLIIEDVDLLEDKTRQHGKLDPLGELQSESCSSVTNQPHALVAKQKHAVSGALAGIFVSLCLHPIDTIKTVVQSCGAGPTSIRYVGQSIISERGITGLYRGITSNITTSAPISAIYTFTYESVKGFLVPSLSKEYHSVAHCTAGACASIATSFIFTPSERIKQQMQVNSQYRNCWNAVYTIIDKGGLPSLYAGWGAVLCRNVPHSIIKFYTYESLKQMFMSSEKPNSQPSTLHTLLCGGLAGSSAALFSTPFDVVKTRFQTQVPGSIRNYVSVLSAFQDICKHEGLKGLYRGLIPRLVMYMLQGALFFTSYELFKSLFSIEIPQHKPEILQDKQGTDDDALLSL